MKMVCEVEGCGEELTEGTDSKGGPMMCAGCRSSSYYWKGEDIGHMRERHSKLKLYGSRLEHFDPRVTKILNDARKSVAATKKRAHEATTSAMKQHH
jgi:hypothetical protein